MMNITRSGTTLVPDNTTLNKLNSTIITTISSILSGTSAPDSSSTCCPNHVNTTTTISGTTTESTSWTTKYFMTTPVHKLQRKIWAQDDYGIYVPYDEQSTTPMSILLLNFFLVIFLMIVIGIAVYPAVKKYCDSTFFGRDSRNSHWIEDNDEMVLTSNSAHLSFALLNGNTRNMEAVVDDSSSSCSLERLT